MAKLSVPRSGSLQYWPRKKARRFLPRVNWNNLDGKGILGFIGYKVGMMTAIVKDNTLNSMTKDKQISIPVSVAEVPPMKILSIRLYKNGKVMRDFIVEMPPKEMKRKIKLPKQVKNIAELEKEANADELRLLVYSVVSKTGIKKTPDIAEIGLGGTIQEKISIAKSFIGKEIRIGDILHEELVDIHGVTKGKGIQGPVKRFGISLKSHKSEKGVRRPGSLGPWHPARVTFRVAQFGQMGFFTRVQYNVKVLSQNRTETKDINPKSGFKNYGRIKTDYIILSGSIPGVEKRPIMITKASRKTKSQEKKKLELKELL